MPSLPEQLLPELRTQWVRANGAREIVQHAFEHLQVMEKEYQQTLSVCLRMVGLDPALNYRVDLESGDIQPVTAENGHVAQVQAPVE